MPDTQDCQVSQGHRDLRVRPDLKVQRDQRDHADLRDTRDPRAHLVPQERKATKVFEEQQADPASPGLLSSPPLQLRLPPTMYKPPLAG
jgi:hypothetical protein